MNMFRFAVLRRLLALVVIPMLIFAAIAVSTTGPTFIQILNAGRLSLSIGVLIAYIPQAWVIIRYKAPLIRNDYLTFGIVYTWFSTALSGLWWVTWRILGQPLGLTDSDFVGFIIFNSCIAAILHLLAPGPSDETHVSPRRWATVGGLIAAGLFLAIVVLYAADLRVGLGRLANPHDRATAPPR